MKSETYNEQRVVACTETSVDLINPLITNPTMTPSNEPLQSNCFRKGRGGS
jgi:hypothetical protein